ncbi:hypothetical protein PTKIN_Ptkin04bG0068900 [Pterospermum kingtungense]
MIATMKMVWKISRDVEISEVEDMIFFVQVCRVKDVERVKKGSPWSFDKQLIMLQEFNGDLRPEEYRWNRVAFWVRVYDLPLGMRNKANGVHIGEKICSMLHMDEGLENGG